MRRRSFGGGLMATLAMAATRRSEAAGLRAVTINYGVPQIPVSTAAMFSVPQRLGLYARKGWRSPRRVHKARGRRCSSSSPARLC